MSAWTWTFVRVDKLTPEQVKSCVNYAIQSNTHNTYGTYSKMTEEQYVKAWIKFHNDYYDDFVYECKVDPSEMTDEYLTKDIKNKMKQWHYRQECYQKCLDGTMSIEEMLQKTHQLESNSFDFYVIKRNGYYYIQIHNEIFRNYEYYDGEFTTVESLIDHCRNCKGNHFIDFSKEYDDFHEWNDEIEKHVREYYEAIGDGNFVVHFG